MAEPRLLICDLGGTLRVFKDPQQRFPRGAPGEWTLCPGVAARLSAHARAGGVLGIATNQPWMQPEGYGAEVVVHAIMMVLMEAIPDPAAWTRVVRAMGRVPLTNLACSAGIQICPHPQGAGCPCQKPQPLMLLSIARWYYQQQGIGMAEMLYIGDQPEDEEAARRAGIQFQWAAVYFGGTDGDNP